MCNQECGASFRSWGKRCGAVARPITGIAANVAQGDQGPGVVRQCSGPDTVGCHVRLQGSDGVLQESRAIINFCDNEGHLKAHDVQMLIAINNPTWEGTGMLGVVVRCTTQPCERGKTRIKE